MKLKSRTSLIIVLICVALLLIVVFQNNDPLQLRFLFWRLEMPKSLSALIFYLCGFASGLFAALKGRKR